MADEIEITPAPEAEAIGAELIEAHHPHLANRARLLYLFTTQKRSKLGRPILANTAKLNPLQRFLSSGHDSVDAGEDFVVLISLFQRAVLKDTQKRALVDHELTHIDLSDKGDLTLRAHDVEEFTSIVRRHGLWFEDVEAFGQAVGEQLALFEGTR